MSPNHMSNTDDPVIEQLTAAIAAVAPDVVDEVATIDPDVDLFEEFGLDSMDRLTIMTALAASSGRTIPEQLYPRLTTVNQIRDHLT
jgi:acyl carrier protein